ncbi:CBS domain-containing protein [Halomarina oriensis]|nr:CBS domain-containing protein [Halomarina oriensis]
MSTERTDLDLRVGGIARPDVVSVSKTTPVGEIAQLMADERVGDAIVTDDGDIVGIVTDRDLTIHLLTDEFDTNVLRGDVAADLTATDVMTADPLTIDAQARVPRLLHHMTQSGVRRVPVVDEGAMAGIITFDDLIVHLTGESAHVTAQLKSLAEVVHAASPTLES